MATTYKISADLDEEEYELLTSLVRDYITENREMARYKHIRNEMTQAELDWHLRHATWVDEIAEKLFPGWRIGKE